MNGLRNITGFLFGLMIGAILFLSLLPQVHADTVQLRLAEDSPSADLHTNAAVSPASPDMMKGNPVQYFGVESCGVKVFWLVFDNGHMARIDEDHHPTDLEKFMESIASLPHDLVVIPCAEQL